MLNNIIVKYGKYTEMPKNDFICKFYKIYEENGKKYFSMIGATRHDINRGDLTYGLNFYDPAYHKMSVEELTEFGNPYYMFNEKFHPLETIEFVRTDIRKCWEKANEWIKGDGNGSIFYPIYEINERMENGFYFD